LSILNIFHNKRLQFSLMEVQNLEFSWFFLSESVRIRLLTTFTWSRCDEIQKFDQTIQRIQIHFIECLQIGVQELHKGLLATQTILWVCELCFPTHYTMNLSLSCESCQS
jgi:hypothetical protein